MRRDRVATRILLILSVVHVATAAPAILPAIIRQRSVEVTKDVTAALEKRKNSDDESSHPLPRMDNDLPSTSGTLPSQDDTSPAPGDPELHSDPPAELGTPQLRLDQPPMPGAPPSQDDTSSASEDPELHRLHGDQPPGWQHTNWRPPGEMLKGESSGTAEIPPLHDDLSWEHANWHPLEETLQGESSVVPPPRDDQRWNSHLNDWHSFWHMLGADGTLSAMSEPTPLTDDQWGQHGDLASPEEALYDGTWSPMSEPAPFIDDQWEQHVNLAAPGETLYQGSPGMSSTTSGVSDGRLQALGAQWLHHGGSEDIDYLYRRHDDAL
jgi:hypothetical protein